MLKIDKENMRIFHLLVFQLPLLLIKIINSTSIDEISSEAAKVKKVCKKMDTSCYRTNEMHINKINGFN